MKVTKLQRQRNAAVYIRWKDTNMGLLVLYRDAEPPLQWTAEVFVNGGSVTVVSSETREGALKLADETLVSTLRDK